MTAVADLVGMEARRLWHALVDNASALVAEAGLLVKAGSLGRARSLTVLAQEELGKALWIYEAFQTAWNTGDETAQPVPALWRDGRSHTKKYLQAIVFGGELAEFWGDYSHLRDRQQDGESWPETFEREQREAEAQAKEANADKQRGFYVDYDPTTGRLSSPADTAPEAVAEDLQTAAQVVEMLLIKDHSRMKFDATTPYDSTLTQQHRLLALSHPQDWAAASPAFRAGAHLAAQRTSAHSDEIQPDLMEPADMPPAD